MSIRLKSLPKGFQEPGAKVSPKAARPKPGPIVYEPGRVLLRLTIEGKAVPWRAPIVMKKVARKPAHVKKWQEHIARCVEAGGFGESRGIAPYRGPVIVRVVACVKAPRKSMIGYRWDKRPDIDNLFKGLGDSISGNVFRKPTKDPETGKTISVIHQPASPIGRVIEDDRQTTDIEVKKRYWSRPLVWIEVVAVDPFDPGPYLFSSSPEP